MVDFIGGGRNAGLDVSTGRLRAALVKGRPGSCKMEWAGSVDLPDGALLESFTEPNIADPAAFVGALKELFRPQVHGRKRVRAALPDYVSRVSILEFDTLQGSRDETDRMIRWRLKKHLPFDVEEASLRYQYLGRFSVDGHDHHRFLACVIKADILAQYEAAFREAGLRADRIEISSFAVWNLYHDHVLRDAGGPANFALMNLFGRKMTVMVFDRGMLHFLRLKDLGKLDMVEGAEGSMNFVRVLKELNASLTFYKENYAGPPVSRVFMAGDIEGLGDLAHEVSANSPIKAEVLDVERFVKGWEASGRPDPPVVYTAACGAALER